MRKIWDIWRKKVQWSMMSELQQVKISSLKSWILASLPLKYKEVL
jgi:hypothetical protein